MKALFFGIIIGLSACGPTEAEKTIAHTDQMLRELKSRLADNARQIEALKRLIREDGVK